MKNERLEKANALLIKMNEAEGKVRRFGNLINGSEILQSNKSIPIGRYRISIETYSEGSDSRCEYMVIETENLSLGQKELLDRLLASLSDEAIEKLKDLKFKFENV